MKLISNDFELVVEAFGGEMSSFKNTKTNIEYLWKGDEKFWKGKNPTLFPIVGNTYDGSYVAKGKTYHFKNHGFIRTSKLVCIAHSDNSATYELKSNEQTREVYPYEFLYHITYTLHNNKIHIAYEITNLDNEEMPFGFGLHPGFNCPLLKGERFEDYHLHFEKPEVLEQLHFLNIDQPYYKKVSLQDIPLDYQLFEDNSTLIYKGMMSKYVQLIGPKHSVEVSLEDYPYLAFWTISRDAPYICIEPWYSHADFSKHSTAFKDRIGMKTIQPKEVFKAEYTIRVF